MTEIPTRMINVQSVYPHYHTEVRSVVTEKDYDEFRRIVAEKKCAGVLEDGKRVYFDSLLAFPRTKFKKSFPNNKMVYSIDEADLIIIDKERTLNSFRIWFPTYYEIGENTYTTSSHILANYATASCPSYHFSTPHQSVIDNFNYILSLIEKDWLDGKDISLPSENVMDEENYEGIDKMLAASDWEIVNMGMNLLTAYDYMKDKNRIALLMVNNWRNWLRNPRRKVNVELRTLFRKITLDFTDMNTITINSNKFWFKIILENQDDPLVISQFNKWTSKYVNTSKQLILTPIK